MPKRAARVRSAPAGQTVIIRSGDVTRPSRVRFGSVTITGAPPSAEAVRANVEGSTAALERAARSLVKPGVVIRARKDVPQYFVADGEPGVFIRRLNGRTQRGRLVGGVFRVID